MQNEKERQEAYEQGRQAGVAQQTILVLRQEIIDVKGGQVTILKKIDDLHAKLEHLNNWRWFVVGIAAALSFLISLLTTSIKGLFK